MSLQLTGMLEAIRRSDEWRALIHGLETASASFPVVRSASAFTLAALAKDWRGPLLFLAADARRAYNVAEQLPVWMDQPGRLHRFVEPTALFYDRAPWDAPVIRQRIAALSACIEPRESSPPVIVASARALVQATMPPQLFRETTLQLRIGDRHSLDGLIRGLAGMGYENAAVVTQPGQFSRRGGIIDIYPLASDSPVRVEFFDDEIDSLRRFDPADQRSVERVSSLRIPPAREALPRLAESAGERLQQWIDSRSANREDYPALRGDAEALLLGAAFPYLEHYLPRLYESPGCLLDYLPADSLVVIDDRDALHAAVDDMAARADANRKDALAGDLIADDHASPMFSWDAIDKRISRLPGVDLSHGGDSSAFQPGQRFGGQLRTMLNQARQYRNRGDSVVIVTEQIERLENLWAEQDAAHFVPTVQQLPDMPQPGALVFARGSMSEGWTLQLERAALHCLTDAEIFGWSRPEPRRRHDKSGGQGSKTPETDFTDWAEGSYVVHVDYGIGRFMGMRHRTVKATRREFLLVEYQGTDTLYVPIHQADRLSRYVGADDKPPKLNKLGKAEMWLKAREKARRNAVEEARELLTIYRKRARARGHAFSGDTAWQHEMEANFAFVETDDQSRVIQEVKRDMQSATPMDRLICGDVGFGKTEVALRAAFKAVQDGMQVAVLVPTTVLAQQHYEVFSGRLGAFPVRVEMLSRFRGKGQQSDIVKRVGNGEIDIVIGTHRLLSADVRFKRLGLIIIDEEQRFGVKHKEHFKSLRAQIDILTLTATPIPRTLYLSLSGIRDISMIQTPPEERLPVITQVGAWDSQLARRAILRELERGGQVFVVHNRIASIHSIRGRIERLAPEASLAVAHGQMPPRQLESVMAAFSRAEHDILVSTSIIENGIDMPRVNTLIVDRADHFGIAQLYQLRGRVGRSAQQGYAYFFHAPGKPSHEARERLATLSENTRLGSGFQVAIRDLELRGSGDILSMRQSGNIESVGLHLYTDMLKQAVRDEQESDSGELAPAASRERIIIDLPLPAYIPTDWIPEMALRLQIYRRIGNILTVADAAAMRQELEDRFGSLPAAVQGLLYQIEVKALALSVHATHVMMPRDKALLKLPYLATLNRERLALELGADVEVTRTEVRFAAADDWRKRLLDLLRAIKRMLDRQTLPRPSDAAMRLPD